MPIREESSEMTHELPNRRETVKLSQAASFLLDECRMVLPGIQALFGFQLIAVFNQRFAEDLEPFDQRLHFLSIALVAISVAVVMSPAAYHRMTGVTQVTQRFLRNSSRLLVASMLPLALGLCLDFYVVGRLVFDSRWPALGAALLLGVVAFFWLLFPSSQRLQELLDRLPPSGGSAEPPE
jgi:DMSO reductase anchor subunit